MKDAPRLFACFGAVSPGQAHKEYQGLVMRLFSTLALACLMIAAVSFVFADEKAADGVLSRAVGIPSFIGAISNFFTPPRTPGFWPDSTFSEGHIVIALAVFSLLATCGCALFAMLARRRREPTFGYAGPLVLSLAIALFSSRLLAWVWPLHSAWASW
ncbi:hypothetical protein [Denitratimonas sp. CY0512]|uniref:hypothetical protein n=1 Tax=Denitratimonas sp. CY0512 TaxID=3131940 RepID=UPI0030A00AD0